MGIIAEKGITTKSNNNQVSSPAKQTVNTMMSSILDAEKMRGRFDELLGKRAPQFISSLVTMVNADPNMQQAFYESPMTVIQAGLKAATFDLPIDQNLGYAYLMPFNNSKRNADGTWTKKKEVAFILGYKGMYQLALRSGCYKTISVTDVREGELKSYNRLTEEIEIEFIEDEDERDSKEVIGYVGYYKLVNGAEKTIYMTIKQLKAHEQKYRKGSEMGKGWKENFDAMCRKTIMRQLIGKYGIMSIDYQTREAAVQVANQIAEEQNLETAQYEVVEDSATVEVADDGEIKPLDQKE